MEIATFAAGCFWGVEDTFAKLPGVQSTMVGYTGGTIKNPTYHQVCSTKTGHAESVQITFDPKIISYNQLLEVFWANHNPTQLNYQGFDIGDQYRSAIFYHTPEQHQIAEASKAALEKSKLYDKPIVTKIVSVEPFYKAEEYHQKYVEKNNRSHNL